MKVHAFKGVVMIALLAAGRTVAQERHGKAAPYNVFVYQVIKTKEGHSPLTGAIEAVRKAVAARKKWFRIVDNPLDATALVEVTNLWEGGNKPALVGRTTAPFPSPELGNRAVVRPGGTGEAKHHIEFRYAIPGRFQSRYVVSGKNRAVAAKEVPAGKDSRRGVPLPGVSSRGPVDPADGGVPLAFGAKVRCVLPKGYRQPFPDESRLHEAR